MSAAIHDSGIRLLETLNSIIDLSVIENNKLELYITRIKLVDLIKERVLLYKVISAKENLEISQHSLVDNILIQSDPKILTNVLNNLIDNAIKYTKKGGVSIESGIDESGQKPVVWIKVADTGIGIPKNRLDHIFDRFTQVSEGQNRDYEGAGLGLTICKKYIEVLQGEISVKSELGTGSEFTIRLPQNIDEPKVKDRYLSQQSRTDFSQALKESKPKILIVVKGTSISNSMIEELENLYEISTTHSPELALVLATKNNYDAILMGVDLDVGINGHSTTGEIHKLPNHKNTPVIAILTGSKPSENLKETYAYHIHKPFTPAKLHDAVSVMLSSPK